MVLSKSRSVWMVLAVLGGVGGCDGGSAGGPVDAQLGDVSASDAGAGGGGAGGAGGIGGAGGAGGAGGVGGNPPALELPGFDTTRRLSDFTQAELEIVCQAQENYLRTFDRAHQEFWCLATAVDAGQVGNDPALTCQRLHDACTQVIDLMERFPDLSPEPSTLSCMFDFQMRQRERCVDPTLGDYRACVVRNIALQETVLDRGQLTCEAAVGQVSIEPVGLFDCPCGTEARIGPTPADDTDWDGVPNDADACPNSSDDLRVTAWGCDRTQDADADGVWDPVDQCLNTEPGAPVLSAIGCSAAQDTDQDDVPNADDICPDTEVGAALVSPGCSAAQDEDADGYPNRADWCPFTPAGAPVREGGCAEGQGEPWSALLLADRPAGVSPVHVSADGQAPVQLFFLPGGVHEADADGFGYRGTLLLELPEHGYLPLPQSDVRFSNLVDGAATSVTGTVPLPFPSVGLFNRFRIGPVGTCTLGVGSGTSPPIVERNLPAQPDRTYLFVECAGGFEAALGDLTLEIGDQQAVLFVLDPLDPGFYLRADGQRIGPLKHLSDVALGFSESGLLHFEPGERWGVEEHARPFDGHVIVEGSLPIETPMPAQIAELSVDGQAVVDLDPREDGVPEIGQTDFEVGANGTVHLDLRFFPAVPIRVDLASATLGMVVNGNNAAVWATGQLGGGQLVLPDNLYLRQEGPLRAAAFVSSTVERSSLVAEGNLLFRGSAIELPLIPNMLDFRFQGRLEASAERLLARGTFNGRLHPWITSRGPVDLEVEVDWSGRAFHVSLTGTLVFRDRLEVGDIYLGSDDIRVGGESISFF